MTPPDTATIARRLGLPQEAVDRLHQRGFLLYLDLDDAEIHERLWRAMQTLTTFPTSDLHREETG